MTVSNTAEKSTLYTSADISRSLVSVSSPEGFILEGMRATTLLPGLSFSLSQGRALYTGNSPTTLSYTTTDNPTVVALSLERFKRYTFPVSLS
jgi:hypothetical protein